MKLNSSSFLIPFKRNELGEILIKDPFFSKHNRFCGAKCCELLSDKANTFDDLKYRQISLAELNWTSWIQNRKCVYLRTRYDNIFISLSNVSTDLKKRYRKVRRWAPSQID